MPKPTSEHIIEQIAKLREVKPRVRKTTAFGDDNHDAIDAQIQVLEERLDDDGIWNNWPDGENNNDYTHIRDCALQALAWMNGEEDAVEPVTEWESLTS